MADVNDERLADTLRECVQRLLSQQPVDEQSLWRLVGGREPVLLCKQAELFGDRAVPVASCSAALKYYLGLYQHNPENTGVLPKIARLLLSYQQYNQPQGDDLTEAFRSSDVERFLGICRSLDNETFFAVACLLLGKNAGHHDTVEKIMVRLEERYKENVSCRHIREFLALGPLGQVIRSGDRGLVKRLFEILEAYDVKAILDRYVSQTTPVELSLAAWHVEKQENRKKSVSQDRPDWRRSILERSDDPEDTFDKLVDEVGFSILDNDTSKAQQLLTELEQLLPNPSRYRFLESFEACLPLYLALGKALGDMEAMKNRIRQVLLARKSRFLPRASEVDFPECLEPLSALYGVGLDQEAEGIVLRLVEKSLKGEAPARKKKALVSSQKVIQNMCLTLLEHGDISQAEELLPLIMQGLPRERILSLVNALAEKNHWSEVLRIFQEQHLESCGEGDISDSRVMTLARELADYLMTHGHWDEAKQMLEHFWEAHEDDSMLLAYADWLEMCEIMQVAGRWSKELPAMSKLLEGWEEEGAMNFGLLHDMATSENSSTSADSLEAGICLALSALHGEKSGLKDGLELELRTLLSKENCDLEDGVKWLKTGTALSSETVDTLLTAIWHHYQQDDKHGFKHKIAELKTLMTANAAALQPWADKLLQELSPGIMAQTLKEEGYHGLIEDCLQLGKLATPEVLQDTCGKLQREFWTLDFDEQEFAVQDFIVFLLEHQFEDIARKLLTQWPRVMAEEQFKTWVSVAEKIGEAWEFCTGATTIDALPEEQRRVLNHVLICLDDASALGPQLDKVDHFADCKEQFSTIFSQLYALRSDSEVRRCYDGLLAACNELVKRRYANSSGDSLSFCIYVFSLWGWNDVLQDWSQQREDLSVLDSLPNILKASSSLLTKLDHHESLPDSWCHDILLERDVHVETFFHTASGLYSCDYLTIFFCLLAQSGMNEEMLEVAGRMSGDQLDQCLREIRDPRALACLVDSWYQTHVSRQPLASHLMKRYSHRQLPEDFGVLCSMVPFMCDDASFVRAWLQAAVSQLFSAHDISSLRWLCTWCPELKLTRLGYPKEGADEAVLFPDASAWLSWLAARGLVKDG